MRCGVAHFALTDPVSLCFSSSLAGESLGFRGEYEVQEADERPALWVDADPESTLHFMVVADDKPRQRLRGLSGYVA
jgi:hypothetical protein